MLEKEEIILPRSILLGLCERSRFSVMDKESAAEELKIAVNDTHDKLIARLEQIRAKLVKINDDIQRQLQIIEECRKHRSAYSLIPEYVGLREEINQEFKRRGIASEAKFAFEYVIALQDEAWQGCDRSLSGVETLHDPRGSALL